MQISSVTESDYLELLAGFEVLADKKWNCEACVRSIDKATRDAVKGCNGGRTYALTAGGREWFRVGRCIGNFYSASVGFWFSAYRRFQSGVLPFEGALLDQPAKVLEIFSVFESIENEKAEIARKNAERKQRG